MKNIHTLIQKESTEQKTARNYFCNWLKLLRKLVQNAQRLEKTVNLLNIFNQLWFRHSVYLCKKLQVAKSWQVKLIQCKMGNDHLIEFHLIEIVIFQLIESFNNELLHIWSLDRIFWDFSVDRIFRLG